jgi:hypothetical protein
VERCFRVLQGRFAILENPSKLWNSSILADIMYACIIMHNMIIENESIEDSLEPLFEMETPPAITRA